MNTKQIGLSFVIVAATLLGSGIARAEDVVDPPTMCLALVADTSGSVSGDKDALENHAGAVPPPIDESTLDPSKPTLNEYALQLFGTANAIKSPEVIAALANGLGNTGIFYEEFDTDPTMRVPFTIIRVDHAAEDAQNFSNKLKQLHRQSAGWTAIGDALIAAITELNHKCPDARKVIDISGDGPNNWGTPSETARDMAESYHIKINGLPIQNPEHPENPPVAQSYKNAVITPNGLLFPVEGFGTFQEAITRKLQSEIASNRPGGKGFAANTAYTGLRQAVREATANRPTMPVSLRTSALDSFVRNLLRGAAL